MKLINILLIWLLFLFAATTSFAQTGETPINIFGYFQNQFKQEEDPNRGRESNTFLMQQLNLFLQKNLHKNWSAFVNLEFLNSYSSSRNTGAVNLEEAWVKYRLNKKFNLKLGLMIPTFNHLNRIKNRTPILPYIVRPLIYESSLSEVVPVDEFTPSRAFVEVNGILPTVNKLKFDYAVFAGNSPNISTLYQPGQSGADTTATFLLGGRIGLRFNELKLGFSSTYDKDSRFQSRFQDLTEFDFTEIPRLRLGLDLSYSYGPFWLQSEFIRLQYDESTDIVNLDKDFIYSTLGWRITDAMIVYGGFWQTRVHHNRRLGESPDAEFQEYVETTTSPNFGAAYHLSDRIVFKGQYVNFDRSNDNPRVPSNPGFKIYSLAVSVSF